MGNHSHIWRLILYLSSAIIELLVLYGITFAFLYIKVQLVTFSPPDLALAVLTIAKVLALIIETIFLLCSFALTVFLVALQVDEKFCNIFLFLVDFISEALGSFVLLGLGCGLAALLGAQNGNDLDSIILRLGTYGLFFLSIVGFVVLLVQATYNSIRYRLSLSIEAWQKVRENRDVL